MTGARWVAWAARRAANDWTVSGRRCPANTSSIWSTTTVEPAPAAASAWVRALSGSAPGTMTATVVPRRRRAGTTPARTSDDLPLPEGPATTSNRTVARRSSAACGVGVAPEEEVGVVGVERRQALVRAAIGERRADGLIEGGFLIEDRALEGDEVGARIDAELVDQRLTGSPQRAQGIGLVPGAVLRQRQLGPAALAQRFLGR